MRKVLEKREHTIRPCVGATYCLDRIYENGSGRCALCALMLDAILSEYDSSSSERFWRSVTDSIPLGLLPRWEHSSSQFGYLSLSYSETSSLQMCATHGKFPSELRSS